MEELIKILTTPNNNIKINHFISKSVFSYNYTDAIYFQRTDLNVVIYLNDIKINAYANFSHKPDGKDYLIYITFYCNNYMINLNVSESSLLNNPYYYTHTLKEHRAYKLKKLFNI